MENLSDNLGQNPQRSSWTPGQYNSGMPPLPQPQHPEDREEIEEGENMEESEGGDGDEEDNGNVGPWNRAEQEARNNDDSQPAENSEAQEEPETGKESNNKEGGQGVDSEILDYFGDAGRQATGEVLRQAWYNVISSYGLTLLYMPFHYVFAYIGGPFSRFFPKAGREWVEKFIKGLPAPKQFQKDIVETLGKAIEPFEIGLVVLVFTILDIAILAILFFLFLLVMAVEDPFHTAVEAVKSVVD